MNDLILWDGDCGFCRRSVEWLQSRDTICRFEASPYQNAPSPPMTPRLFRACSRAVHVVTQDGAILRGGRAVLFLLERTSHHAIERALWRFLSHRFLAWPIECAYRIVARNRRFFSRFLFKAK